jgi:hypothetical protein
MHSGLRRINIPEPLSTAVLICNGFIPRRPSWLLASNRLRRLDRGPFLSKEWA